MPKTICPNCGAPLSSETCEYCGAVHKTPKPSEITEDSLNIDVGETTVIAETNVEKPSNKFGFLLWLGLIAAFFIVVFLISFFVSCANADSNLYQAFQHQWTEMVEW